MSERHPIIAITGSSGAGTSSVTRTFENIFRRENVRAAIIEGDSFHRYDREEMQIQVEQASQEGRALSQLWVVQLATGEKRLLIGQDGVQPAWSPHGQRIAFWGENQNSRAD